MQSGGVDLYSLRVRQVGHKAISFPEDFNVRVRFRDHNHCEMCQQCQAKQVENGTWARVCEAELNVSAVSVKIAEDDGGRSSILELSPTRYSATASLSSAWIETKTTHCFSTWW